MNEENERRPDSDEQEAQRALQRALDRRDRGGAPR